MAAAKGSAAAAVPAAAAVTTSEASESACPASLSCQLPPQVPSKKVASCSSSQSLTHSSTCALSHTSPEGEVACESAWPFKVELILVRRAHKGCTCVGKEGEGGQPRQIWQWFSHFQYRWLCLALGTIWSCGKSLIRQCLSVSEHGSHASHLCACWLVLYLTFVSKLAPAMLCLVQCSSRAQSSPCRCYCVVVLCASAASRQSLTRMVKVSHLEPALGVRAPTAYDCQHSSYASSANCWV
eukprot:SM000309S11875  [mRNA]  locus=s309:89091:92770:- [translate_table: standard]